MPIIDAMFQPKEASQNGSALFTISELKKPEFPNMRISYQKLKKKFNNDIDGSQKEQNLISACEEDENSQIEDVRRPTVIK